MDNQNMEADDFFSGGVAKSEALSNLDKSVGAMLLCLGIVIAGVLSMIYLNI